MKVKTSDEVGARVALKSDVGADTIRKIGQMTAAELLAYVVENPQELIDPYYYKFSRAIRKRAKELLP